jgi:rod shape-determining protein MreC
MENFFVRYKNPLVLMAVLFIQVVALATQVKRQENRPGSSGGGTRLIRVWTVTAFTPVEKMLVSTGHFFRNGWHNYADLRDARKQNKALQDEVARLQMEQVRLRQDADQARRLQAVLEFKQRYISRTVAAQIIGTSGTEQSRVIIIDKGSHDGIKADMPVVTPDGIVGKVKDVFPLSSQVLLINDHDSGAGVILESSRLQGIVKGTSTGELQITDIMADEKIEAGDHVITSGGDRIFPKGFSVGSVISATPDHDNDPFMVIKIKPAADLRRLEEVLVVTRIAEETPVAAATPVPMRAADILSQRLPSVPKQDANAPSSKGGAATTPTPGLHAATPTPTPTPARTAEPTATGTAQKPGGANVTGTAKQPAAGTGTTATAPARKTGGAEQTPGNVAVPAKPPAANAGTSAAPGSGAAISAPPKKAGAEQKKPPSAGQTGTTGAPDATATATPAPPKPKAPPKKPTGPEGGTPSAAPGDSKAKTGDSKAKTSDRPAAVAPAATPTPTPETPPR